MSKRKLLQSICHLLEEGENLVLATIPDHSGSTPRSVGTKMVVRPDGAIIGTIGGGGLAEFPMRGNLPARSLKPARH